MKQKPAFAPAIWSPELANVLLVAERKKRISKAAKRTQVEIINPG